MMRFQQQLRFSKTLGLGHLLRISIDPALMVLVLFCLAFYFEGRLASHYIVLSTIIFSLSFPGSWSSSQTFRRDLVTTANQWLLVVTVLLFFGYATALLEIFPYKLVLSWILITPIILLLSHALAAKFLTSKRYLSHVRKSTVIVGFNELGLQLKHRMQKDPVNNGDFRGFFDDSENLKNSFNSTDDNKLLGSIRELSDFVKFNAIEKIYIALPSSYHLTVLSVLDELKDTTASIYFVPDFFMTDLIQARIDDVEGMPVVALCETPFVGLDGTRKRVFDFLFASFLLVLLTPILFITAIGVKFSSSGPILFKQRRYGLDGQEILIYKFRSMIVTEEQGVVTQATKGDIRVTPFGRFIRKTSLDELPQLINVLQGRMSVVGPRPHAVSHNEMYRKLIKGYMVRHKVKPGMTGWAQVNGFRGETKEIESMKNRIQYDIEYLRKWSLALDVLIILKTIALVFKDSKAY